MNKTWSYPSIARMLLYLSINTRINIAMAVSQVARFNHLPKKSHATAPKTIVRYLHQTADKGTIISPSGDLSLDCYVDANFSGLYGRDPDCEPSYAKSRTGYLITLENAPVIWKSQLQTKFFFHPGVGVLCLEHQHVCSLATCPPCPSHWERPLAKSHQGLY
jgi:hypothetical protein